LGISVLTAFYPFFHIFGAWYQFFSCQRKREKKLTVNAVAERNHLSYFVDRLTFHEKVDRSLALIENAYREFGDALVVANSLGKDSVAVWHLAKRVSTDIRGFIVTTRFKPKETVAFMNEQVRSYPELRVYQNDEEIAPDLYKTDPDRCCELLKVKPTRRAIQEMGVRCWVTGLRCTEGRTRTDYREVEQRDRDLVKLNPILLWKEREVWQYLALNNVEVNPLYAKGYRSLGCEPCTRITTDDNERAGRWIGTSKCGGECGIHTRPLKA
jgi:phosphoadenosine phosphosulfate reductase